MNNIATVLENEGVNAKGFGIIFQAVMFDVSLPVGSKALYALLCSYLGSGAFIFPKRESILKILNISKNAYYRALQPLIDNDYVSIKKAKGYINRNIYIINNSPNKVNTHQKPDDNSESMLSIDGISAQGYGFIPKIIMTDSRLSIKSKALIALLYSLTGSGSCAYPHRETLCVALGISKNTYCKALNQLIECNYIEVHQRRQNKGKFTVNDYTLITNPSQRSTPASKTPLEAESPCLKNEDNRENSVNTGISPCLKNEDNTDTDRVSKIETLPCLKNEDNNNSISNNSIIDSMIGTSNLILTTPIQVSDNDEIISEKIHLWTHYDNIKKSISEFEKAKDPFIRGQVLGMKNTLLSSRCLIDLLCSDAKDFKYHGRLLSRSQLIDMLSLLRPEEISGVIQETVYHFEICKEKYKIYEPVEYLKTLLVQHIENFSLSSDWWQD